jgi:hypothetical protein
VVPEKTAERIERPKETGVVWPRWIPQAKYITRQATASSASFHVPVYHSVTVSRKITLEAPYHKLTNAAHITYVELDGDPSLNIGAFEKIVRLMG